MAAVSRSATAVRSVASSALVRLTPTSVTSRRAVCSMRTAPLASDVALSSISSTAASTDAAMVCVLTPLASIRMRHDSSSVGSKGGGDGDDGGATGSVAAAGGGGGDDERGFADDARAKVSVTPAAAPMSRPMAPMAHPTRQLVHLAPVVPGSVVDAALVDAMGAMGVFGALADRLTALPLRPTSVGFAATLCTGARFGSAAEDTMEVVDVGAGPGAGAEVCGAIGRESAAGRTGRSPFTRRAVLARRTRSSSFIAFLFARTLPKIFPNHQYIEAGAQALTTLLCFG